MIRGKLLVAHELLVQMVEGLKPDENPRAYRVVKNALPCDTEVVGSSLSDDGRTIQIHVQSETLDVNDGIVAAPLLETVYLEDISK